MRTVAYRDTVGSYMGHCGPIASAALVALVTSQERRERDSGQPILALMGCGVRALTTGPEQYPAGRRGRVEREGHTYNETVGDIGELT